MQITKPNLGTSTRNGHTAPVRRGLPDEREAITHKFTVGGHEGYITVGLYSDRTPGEVFITMSKEGSTIRGLMDSVGILVSLALQHGIPLTKMADKFRYSRFDPQGPAIGCGEITMASSVLDYVFHWLIIRFTAEGESLREWKPEKDMTAVKTDTAAPLDPTKP